MEDEREAWDLDTGTLQLLRRDRQPRLDPMSDGLSVLLIEDDDDQRETVAGWLRRAFPGSNVVQAASLSAARDALQEGQFDVLLTDLGLPDSVHDETMEQLCHLAGRTPIIALTGRGGDPAALNALQAGAEDYLVKGQVTPELLRRAVLYAHERQGLKRRLIDLANYDSLTGLLNRAPFQKEVKRAWNRAMRYGDHIALLFVDLDQFKEINDSFGHDAGDHLLATVAQRLVRCVRKTDYVARLGGDEFAILFDRISDHHLQEVLARMLKSLRQPVDLNHATVQTSASVGVARPDSTCNDVGDLFRHADAAMYQAKAAGRDGYRHFDSVLYQKLRTQRDSVQNLRQAIEKGEFILYYQPILNTQTGRAEGAEGLVRWHDSTGGRLLPSAFIERLERDALIVDLGRRVLRQACEELAEQRANGHDTVPISINVSAKDLEGSDFVDFVAATLRDTALEASSLKLEITERMLMRDLARAQQMVGELADLGVDTAIDDFGMGHSSLAYLRSLPITTLKIDRAFVSGTPDGETDKAIVEAVIRLAHALGYRVVAEGVESSSQLAALREMGCDAWQGYLCARPMSARQWRAWSADHFSSQR